MNTLYYVTEYNQTSDAIALHVFYLEVDKNEYKASVSIEAFKKVSSNSKLFGDGFGFLVKDSIEFELSERYMVSAGVLPKHLPSNRLPRVAHKSLWDFYSSIGYDYKKKKFNRTPVPDLRSFKDGFKHK